MHSFSFVFGEGILKIDGRKGEQGIAVRQKGREVILVGAIVTAIEFRSKVVCATLDQSCCGTSNLEAMVNLNETTVRQKPLGIGTILPDDCLGR